MEMRQRERLQALANAFVAHPGSRWVASQLRRSLRGGPGFTVLLGRPEVGKTSLMDALTSARGDITDIGGLVGVPRFVAPIDVKPRQFCEALLHPFRQPPRPNHTTAMQYQSALHATERQRIRCVVVDEADNLLRDDGFDRRLASIMEGLPVRWILVGRDRTLVEAAWTCHATHRPRPPTDVVPVKAFSTASGKEAAMADFLLDLHARGGFEGQGEMARPDVVDTFLTASRGVPGRVKRIVIAAAIKAFERKGGPDAILADDVLSALAGARW